MNEVSRISIRLPTRHWEVLDVIAKRQAGTRSGIIRKLIREYVDEVSPYLNEECTDRMGTLATFKKI